MTGLSGNQLAGATSPYLLQHAGNPVHWRQWGAAALAEAKARDRPLLVSIGYAACHWCHVMAHESFEDEATAALMNRLFVNVKVDREERPDIDHVYMSALHAMGQQGGWPLTMFVGPDGAPLFGGTYWPPEPRWGRPSFAQILAGVDRAWREKRGELLAQGSASLASLAQAARARPGADIAPEDLGAAAGHLLRLVDPVNGGVGEAPKFPNAPIFRFLWNEAYRAGDAAAAQAVHGLLAAICAGGIYDHLGGGFARYSTDAQWHVPHFEKMLYDNAQILELLALAQGGDPQPLYERRARETFGWLRREMLADGAFAAAQDADQEGEEGRFFVWRADEVDAALGAEAEQFKRAYDVSEGGNWEGSNVLRRVAPEASPEAEARLDAARAKLFALREARAKPARDDKILADWNGLLIAALARASAAFAAPDFLDAARRAFGFVEAHLHDEAGRLAHSWRDGRVGAAALLDDYGAMALAALALFEATGERGYLERASSLAQEAQARFGVGDGGLAMTAQDATDVPGARPRQSADGVVPCGQSLMAEAFARLHHLTGEARWREAALALFRSLSGDRRQLPQSPALLAAADLLEGGAVVVVAGALADTRAQALAQAALAAGDPAICVLRAGLGEPWPPESPASGKFAVDGAPAAYVCRAGACSLPIAGAPELRRLLRRA